MFRLDADVPGPVLYIAGGGYQKPVQLDPKGLAATGDLKALPSANRFICSSERVQVGFMHEWGRSVWDHCAQRGAPRKGYDVKGSVDRGCVSD